VSDVGAFSDAPEPVRPANRYAAFLGGINVGGHRATGEQLCAVAEALGHADVSSFLASGNLVFSTIDEPVPTQIAAELEQALERELGYPVPVFLRAEREVRGIAIDHPFDPTDVAASDGKHQVMLLAEAPGREAREQVMAMGNETDRLAIDDRELHWLPSGRMTDSELDLSAIGRILGPGTIRTMNTIQRLLKKYFEED
jgi:uncharacterized protein (DUF1697 family)